MRFLLPLKTVQISVLGVHFTWFVFYPWTRTKSTNKHDKDYLALRWAYLSRIVTKPTQWHLRPAKTRISLGIRPVWSESSLSAWRKLGSLATHWAHSEDYSDQTGRMSSLCAHAILLVLSWVGSFGFASGIFMFVFRVFSILIGSLGFQYAHFLEKWLKLDLKTSTEVWLIWHN